MAQYTADQLLTSTEKLAKWRGSGYSNSTSMKFIECIPFRGTRSVVYHWQHLGSNKATVYDVYLEFNQVKFGDSVENSQTWDEREYKGEMYYFEKPHIKQNPIRIRCSCPDFQFRGSYQAYNEKILYGGTYKHYVRKTPRPPEGRPYANPDPRGVMMCKHIYNTIVRSITENWIRS